MGQINGWYDQRVWRNASEGRWHWTSQRTQVTIGMFCKGPNQATEDNVRTLWYLSGLQTGLQS